MFFNLGPRALEILQAPCYLNPSLDIQRAKLQSSATIYQTDI